MKFKQLILLGPPGLGVKEHGLALSQRWHIPHVSMDQLLHEAIAKESAIGLEVRPYLEAKEPVPDALAMKLIRKRFEQPDTMLQGWVLDGFPRTVGQAEALNQFLSAVGQPPATVAYLKAMTGLLINRLSAQEHNASVSAIRHQLTRHQEEMTPILEYYRQQGQLTTVNASLSNAEVTQSLSELLEDDTGAAQFIRDESELDSLLAKESLLVVDCMASWCGSCKLVTPLIDQLADAYKDRVNVMKIDFDVNKHVPKRFGLTGMPAVMFFKGGQLVETLTGVKPYQVYNTAVSHLLE